MNEVKIKELNFSETLNIWWDFFWRGLIMLVVSTLAGGILGAIFGFAVQVLASQAGENLESIENISEIVGEILSIIIGALFSYVYLFWLLKSKLGGYRLTLLKVDHEQHSSSE